MASWGSCNYKQWQELRDRIEKMDNDRQQFCEECARELAARLLALVINRTPVGTKPRIAAKDENDKKALGGMGAKKTTVIVGASGKKKRFLTREGAIFETYWSGYIGGALRRGWTSKNESDATNKNNLTVKDHVKRLTVTRSGGTYKITVTNPMKYASYVEFGHKQKPGRYVPALGKRLKKRWVKGQFMLSISEKELEKLAPNVLDKKLTAFLTEALNG